MTTPALKLGITVKDITFPEGQNSVLLANFVTLGGYNSLGDLSFTIGDANRTGGASYFLNGTKIEAGTKLSYEEFKNVKIIGGTPDHAFVRVTEGDKVATDSFKIETIEKLNEINGTHGADFLNGTEGADLIKAGYGNDTVYGGGGNDTIHGGYGDDIIYGDASTLVRPLGINEANYVVVSGDDTIYAGHGNDTVYGGNGNDYIHGGYGNDTLNGDSGNDTIIGGYGNDVINGGAGNDFLAGGFGDDVIYGDGRIYTVYDGPYTNGKIDISRPYPYPFGGDDTIHGGYGNDTVYGGVGNDTIYGGHGNDVLNGETGKDKIYGGEGDDTIDGGDGNDFIHGGNGNDRIFGGNGDDDIRGGNGDDVIYGDGKGYPIFDRPVPMMTSGWCGTVPYPIIPPYVVGGNDTIYAGEGNDTVYGGYGDDFIHGGNGKDTLYGDDGNDTIHGGNGNDFIQGGQGDDIITGGAGDDIIYGDDRGYILYDLDYRNGDSDSQYCIMPPIRPFPVGGDDIINAGDGNDTVYGGNGNDRINGGNGNDKLNGDAGDDIINGGNGDDIINGGSGNDILRGGAGNDVLRGGAGDDVLSGGAGKDQFVFNTNEGGLDVVLDFQDGLDQLIFEYVTNVNPEIASFAEPQVKTTQLGNDLLVSFNGTEVLLKNMNAEDFDHNDYKVEFKWNGPDKPLFGDLTSPVDDIQTLNHEFNIM